MVYGEWIMKAEYIKKLQTMKLSEAIEEVFGIKLLQYQRVMVDNQWGDVMLSDDKVYPHCGLCKHAINRREWEDQINYGNGTYDIICCEEVTCKINGLKYHPMQFGCDGEQFEHIKINFKR